MIYLKLLTVLCSVSGAAISLYFILATYRIIADDLIGRLPICNVDGTEKRIVDTSFGRILRIPNSIYGFLYYLGILILTLGWWGQWSEQLLFMISTLSCIVVLFSIFLYFVLTKKLETTCPLCVTTHIINAVLFLIFITRSILITTGG